jgi:hypothetical protein
MLKHEEAKTMLAMLYREHGLTDILLDLESIIHDAGTKFDLQRIIKMLDVDCEEET